MFQEKNLAVGEEVLSIMYSYRSVSRAIPQVEKRRLFCARSLTGLLRHFQTTQDQTNKVEVSEKRYEVLRPEIIKMKQLLAFQDRAVELIADVVKRITDRKDKERNFCSEEFLVALARNFSLFMILDATKNMKASMTNDFAIYKRYENKDAEGEKEPSLHEKKKNTATSRR